MKNDHIHKLYIYWYIYNYFITYLVFLDLKEKSNGKYVCIYIKIFYRLPPKDDDDGYRNIYKV